METHEMGEEVLQAVSMARAESRCEGKWVDRIRRLERERPRRDQLRDEARRARARAHDAYPVRSVMANPCIVEA